MILVEKAQYNSCCFCCEKKQKLHVKISEFVCYCFYCLMSNFFVLFCFCLIRLSITVKTIINGCHRSHFVFSDSLNPYYVIAVSVCMCV